jgi:alpha-amylase
MLALSDRIDSIKENTKNREQLTLAKEHLYAAQCNCPYWHGVFGGIYLPHIRKQVYAEMLLAESILRKLERGKGVVVHETDMQGDGFVDFILESESTRAAISPSWGGMLIEYSLYEPACHLTDTISRYDEGYHRQLARAVSPDQEGSGSTSIHDQVLTKEPGLEKLLTHDPYLKRAFIEHLLPVESSAVAFEFNHQPSLWRSTKYRMGYEKIESGIKCTTSTQIYQNGLSVQLAFRKEMQMLPTGQLIVRYSLATDQPMTVRFVIEQNLTFQAGHSDDRFVLINGSVADPKWLDGRSENLGVRSVALVDEWQGAAVEGTVNLSAELWRFPLFSVSQSEGGFEKVYQGTTLLLSWILDLSPTETEIQFTMKAGKLTDRFPSRRM